MAYYYARVELHGAQDGDDSYKVLHECMEQAGFVQEIVKNKRLPRGTYITQKPTNQTPEEVGRVAFQAAEKTKKDSTIVVVRFKSKDDIAFHNLKDA